MCFSFDLHITFPYGTQDNYLLKHIEKEGELQHSAVHLLAVGKNDVIAKGCKVQGIPLKEQTMLNGFMCSNYQSGFQCFVFGFFSGGGVQRRSQKHTSVAHIHKVFPYVVIHIAGLA